MGTITLKSVANCDQPADVVWSLVTDASAFHALGIPHMYEPFDPLFAEVGTKFRGRSVMGGGGWTMFVSDWAPQQRFGFGSLPATRDFLFELEPDGAGTTVTFSRRFHVPIWKRVLGRADLRRLCDATASKLGSACARLARGESDGLDRT